ncbi:hypothetical protein LEP1GSC170_3833 [Leptospira interrogans serovar Bataviae str. HAI135]|nr:hypothetical protein LEP1GSC170_3833 [Leptospira interrogans serovar Bataviae str. HAI135]
MGGVPTQKTNYILNQILSKVSKVNIKTWELILSKYSFSFSYVEFTLF